MSEGKHESKSLNVQQQMDVTKLSMSKQLDYILNSINSEKGLSMKNQYELELLFTNKGKSAHLTLLFSILLTDGYIKPFANDSNRYYLTTLGKRFVGLHGYRKAEQKEKLKKMWEVAVIIATIANAAAILWLTWLSIKNQ